MVLLNRDDHVCIYTKEYNYMYLMRKGRGLHNMSNWHEPLIRENGQRAIGPTILVEWEK